MKIGGLVFPYDRERDVSAHGRFAGFVMRTHPLAMWTVALLVGIVAGFMLHTPGSFP